MKQNKDTKKEVPYYSEILTCKLCGAQYTRSNSYNHKKTNKHKLFKMLDDDVLRIVKEKNEKKEKKKKLSDLKNEESKKKIKKMLKDLD